MSDSVGIRNDGKGLGPFNLLEILHLTRHELKHSHFLAWLLDPGGSHGLKDAFARYLLGLLERKGLELPQPKAWFTRLPAAKITEIEQFTPRAWAKAKLARLAQVA